LREIGYNLESRDPGCISQLDSQCISISRSSGSCELREIGYNLESRDPGFISRLDSQCISISRSSENSDSLREIGYNLESSIIEFHHSRDLVAPTRS
jgi:hypothetical protein